MSCDMSGRSICDWIHWIHWIWRGTSLVLLRVPVQDHPSSPPTAPQTSTFHDGFVFSVAPALFMSALPPTRGGSRNAGTVLFWISGPGGGGGGCLWSLPTTTGPPALTRSTVTVRWAARAKTTAARTPAETPPRRGTFQLWGWSRTWTWTLDLDPGPGSVVFKQNWAKVDSR